MKHTLRKSLKNWSVYLEQFVIRHLFILSLALAGFLTFHANTLLAPINIRSILPDIITYESCNLALLGLILTLILGLRDGIVHKMLLNKGKAILTSAYWYLFKVICSTLSVILISLVIMGITPWTDIWIKRSLQAIGIATFSHSLIGTVYLLYYFISMTISDAIISQEEAEKLGKQEKTRS